MYKIERVLLKMFFESYSEILIVSNEMSYSVRVVS